MGQGISHLPHLTHTEVGNNKWDPIHKSIFEVYFTLPTPIASEFKTETDILTEQVTKVSGLDALQKTTSAGSQKFLGVDISFLNPVMDNTYAELEIDLNLNLRNGHDAYVLKLFKAWAKLGYDMSDGTRTLKADYMTDSLRIAEANRDGTIWRSYVFKHVMLTEVTGLGDLDYTVNDAVSLKVKFRADYWEEELA